jgi:hypothetical protein
MFDRYLVPFTAIPHLVFAALLALAVSAIVGLLGKRTRRERLLHSAWFFTCSMASVIAGSWLMFLIHG